MAARTAASTSILQKQMYPSTPDSPIPPPWYQALAGGDSGGFLEGLWGTASAMTPDGSGLL